MDKMPYSEHMKQGRLRHRYLNVSHVKSQPASVALLVALQYVLPGYSYRRVWVQGPDWPDHCVRL